MNLLKMQVFHSAEEIRQYRDYNRQQGLSLGFVPTMGALHEAHLALSRRAQAENNLAVVSIFVNPTQFNNPEDLKRYPRRSEADLTLLRQAGMDAVLMPSVSEIYGDQVRSEDLDLAGLDQGMEGEYRPGHFAGVATVIRRFFELLQPTRAYFGEKDYQQLRVIEHLNHSLKLGVSVVGCPTERNAQGLALSSRNFRLSEQGLRDAEAIYRAEDWARSQWGKMTPQAIKEGVWQALAASPLRPEYVEIADTRNMQSIAAAAAGQKARIFVAAYCEEVRLIDNLSLL